jgi:hypothetical protein
MTEKFYVHVNTRTISALKICFLGLLFGVLIANCHPGKKTASNTPTVPANQSGEKINWLDLHDEPGWDTVAFSSDPDDSVKIGEEKARIRAYLEGALAEYNNVKPFIPGSPTENFAINDVQFFMKSRSPLRFSVQAFLNPPVRSSGHDQGHPDGAGTHIIPPPPPPPTK